MPVSRTAIGALEPEYYADVLIEIRAGSGDQDTELFVGDLLEMYRNYSQNRGVEYGDYDATRDR